MVEIPLLPMGDRKEVNMKELKLDIRTDEELQEIFKNKDLVSIEELIEKVKELNKEIEEYEEIKK